MRQTFRKLNMRIGALALAVLLLLCMIPPVSAAEAEGSCGNGVTWSLDAGVLTISGSGAIQNYTEHALAPWNAYADSIRAIIIQPGVTAIGNFAFFTLEKVTTVTITSTVTKIGDWAFYGCEELAMLDLGRGVQEIGRSAFERCYALVSLRLPNSLTTLRYHAFYRCEGLASVTIPSSIQIMEAATFAYCTGLRSATVLAAVAELPRWTFYGCKQLTTVSLAPVIQDVGANAFYECNLSEEPKNNAVEGNISVNVSTTVEKEDTTVTTKDSYTENSNATITSQTVTTETAGGSKTTEVEIDAVLDAAEGWKDLINKVGMVINSGADSVTVDTYVKGEATVSGKDIGQFAGQSVKLNIHTYQGAVWRIDAEKLTPSDLKESYDLSFVVRPVTERTEAQTAAVGEAPCYTVEFFNEIDFKVEVELPLSQTLARQTAVFFAPNEEGAYERMQAVMIDNKGIAHFYLAFVDTKVQYLIGINVPKPETEEETVDDVIIPDVMLGEQEDIVQMSEIKYIVTGRKSSWGMDVNQVTWIMVAVLVGCAVIVGVVMFVMNKRKLKMGYVPDMDWEEDEDE